MLFKVLTIGLIKQNFGKRQMQNVDIIIYEIQYTCEIWLHTSNRVVQEVLDVL